MSRLFRGRRLPFSTWIAAGLFVFVLALRLVALARYLSLPNPMPTGGDIAFYSHWAERILAGELTDGRAFYALPLYAYWLAALYKIFGLGAFFPAFLQCAADAGTAVLDFHVTAKTLTAADPNQADSNKLAIVGGILAALAWAIFLPAQAFAIVLMPTALAVFVFWFLVWQILRRAEAPGRLTCLWWGVLAGAMAMAVATVLFLVPLLLAALFWRWPRSDGARWPAICRNAAVLLAGVALGTAPCWVHNRFVAHEPVFLSAHSGINFWIGNNPDATGYPRFGEIRAGQAEMLQDSVALAERAAGKTLTRAEVSAFWSAKARDYIAKDFGGWMRLLGRKIWNFWNAYQFDDLSVIAKFREQGVIFPGLGFGFFAALALAGLPFAFRVSREIRWIAAAVGLQMLALLAVFITERYRLAAAPGLIVLAVVGLLEFWKNGAALRLRPVALFLGLLGAATFVVSWSPRDPALWALAPYNAGREALEANDLPLAQKKLELAHAYVPQNPEINLALGNLWLATGDRARARSFYRDTLAVQPEHKSALNNLGVLALEEADYLAARVYFERALRAEPANAKTHYLLARALLALGQREPARAEIARALQLSPAQPEFLAFEQELH